MKNKPHWIVVGRISRPYGIKGSLKIFSYTDPPENILKYRPWHIQMGSAVHSLEILSGRRQNKTLIVQLNACDTPEKARTFSGLEIMVERAQLPQLAPHEYYWVDLIGLTVLTLEEQNLGEVSSLFETGSNDVLVVKGDRERLIPYLPHVVKMVDLDKKHILVDWDPEI